MPPSFIEVADGVFITEEEHEANQRYDEMRDLGQEDLFDNSNVY